MYEPVVFADFVDFDAAAFELVLREALVLREGLELLDLVAAMESPRRRG